MLKRVSPVPWTVTTFLNDTNALIVVSDTIFQNNIIYRSPFFRILVHCPKNKKHCKRDVCSVFLFSTQLKSGAGGIRTLVQTLNQYAFYMLSLSLIVEQYSGTNTQNTTLALVFLFCSRAVTEPVRNSLRLVIRPESNVSTCKPSRSRSLTGNGANLLYFDQAARA